MSVCKQKQTTQIQVFHHSSSLPATWDKLLPPDHFLQTSQIVSSEQSMFPDLGLIYVLLLNNNEPVAAAYFQVLHLKDYHLNVAQLSSFQAFAWKGFIRVVRPKLLVAGHLFRHDIESFFWDKTYSDFEAYEFYQAAIRKAVKASAALAVLVKDMPGRLITYFQHYAPEYLLLRNDISMVMKVPAEWKSLRDYEKALKHKYAQRFRKIRSNWEPLEVSELSVETVAEQQDVIYSLYKQVSDRQQVRLGTLSKEYLPLLKKLYPEHLKIWMAYEDGNPIAFFSAWVHNGTFDMFYIGLDYPKNDRLQLYFNILFFSVEQAIDLGKQKLILGRTALEAKARLGCKPDYLATYLFIRNGFLRKIIFRLQQRITSQEGEWENRHPFKADH